MKRIFVIDWILVSGNLQLFDELYHPSTLDYNFNEFPRF